MRKGAITFPESYQVSFNYLTVKINDENIVAILFVFTFLHFFTRWGYIFWGGHITLQCLFLLNSSYWTPWIILKVQNSRISKIVLCSNVENILGWKVRAIGIYSLRSTLHRGSHLVCLIDHEVLIIDGVTWNMTGARTYLINEINKWWMISMLCRL